jgi:hypothetical protein
VDIPVPLCSCSTFAVSGGEFVSIDYLVAINHSAAADEAAKIEAGTVHGKYCFLWIDLDKIHIAVVVG